MTTKNASTTMEILETFYWETITTGETEREKDEFHHPEYYLRAYQGLTLTVANGHTLEQRTAALAEAILQGLDRPVPLERTSIRGETWFITDDSDIYDYFEWLVGKVQEVLKAPLPAGLIHYKNDDTFLLHQDLFLQGPSHAFLYMLHGSGRDNHNADRVEVGYLFREEGPKEAFHDRYQTYLPRLIAATRSKDMFTFEGLGIVGMLTTAHLNNGRWLLSLITRVHGHKGPIVLYNMGLPPQSMVPFTMVKGSTVSTFEGNVYEHTQDGTRGLCHAKGIQQGCSLTINGDTHLAKMVGAHNLPDLPYSDFAFWWSYEKSTEEATIVPMDQLTTVHWNKALWEKELILNHLTRDIVHTLLTTPTIIPDIVNNKGNADILLFTGPPGLGKTLLAEAICDYLERPLIKLRMMSLKLNQGIAEFEKSLLEYTRINDLVGGVLLINEADILIESRESGDINRNSMVNAFLDVMEYSKGTVILTTNRETELDPAVWSRMTYRLAFNNDMVDQYLLWTRLFERSPFEVPSHQTLEQIAAMAINARTARNLVDVLARIAHAKGTIPDEGEILAYIQQMNAHTQQATGRKTAKHKSPLILDEPRLSRGSFR